MTITSGSIIDMNTTFVDVEPSDAQLKESVSYVNRVWDTQVVGDDKYHYWKSAIYPDVDGSEYDGPGVFGVDTSDFCVTKINKF